MASYSSNCDKFSLKLLNFNVSNVTNMRAMFYTIGSGAKKFYMKFEDFDTSSVTNMSYMFNYTGEQAEEFTIDGLDTFDMSNVTNVNSMFFANQYNTAGLRDYGTINIYATDITAIMNSLKNVKATINLHVKPTEYQSAFLYSATGEGSLITVNYTSEVDNIDSIIATKSPESNVVKGSLIEN